MILTKEKSRLRVAFFVVRRADIRIKPQDEFAKQNKVRFGNDNEFIEKFLLFICIN
jgi:hypothetical protein